MSIGSSKVECFHAGRSSDPAEAAKKRALIVGYLTYRSDARVKNQVRVLTENGYAVDVICLDEDLEASGDMVNLLGIALPRYRGSSPLRYVYSYLGFLTKAAVAAARLSFHRRYNLAIACNMPDFLVLSVLIPRLLGARIVLDVHDPLPELYNVKFGRPNGSLGQRFLMLEERVSAWLAHRVLATHDLHARRLQAAGIPARKLRVVLNAPNSGLFSYSHQPLERPGRFRLVYHGTIAARHGLEIAFRAVHLLRHKIPEIELLLIGRGDGLEDSKRLSRKLGLDSLIRFERPLPIEQLPPLLHDCSVGLVPPRNNAANQIMLPVKLMEFAMLGVPIAAARLDPITQYFDSNAIEFFAPDSAEDLAGAIARLYEHPERRASMAREANRTALGLCANWAQNYLEAVG